MNPLPGLSAADRVLRILSVLLMIAGALVAYGRGDVRRAQRHLRAQRDSRVRLEDEVDKLRGDLDGALATIHELSERRKPPEPETPPAA